MGSENDLPARLRECASLLGGAETLSDKTGIPRRTLETYLSGSADPKGRRLASICQATGVSGHWLLTGEGERFVGSNQLTLIAGAATKRSTKPGAEKLLINPGALAVIIEYVWQLGPDRPLKERCQLAAQQYTQMTAEGFITPESCGERPDED